MKKSIIIALLASLMSSMAIAHPGHEMNFNFTQGLAHPISGSDHLLAMIAIGFWASFYRGITGFWLPVVFISGMILGSGLGFAQVPFPMVETAIIISVGVIGLALSFKDKMPIAISAALALMAGSVHGYAHGAEGGTMALPYIAGFILTTSMMHLIGGIMGVKLALIRRAAPYIGGAMAIASAFMLTA